MGDRLPECDWVSKVRLSGVLYNEEVGCNDLKRLQEKESVERRETLRRLRCPKLWILVMLSSRFTGVADASFHVIKWLVEARNSEGKRPRGSSQVGWM